MNLSTRALRLVCAITVTAVNACLAGADGTVFTKADPLWRPPHAPAASDVVMRSLRPRLEGEEHASIPASIDFHATRHEWTYLNYEMQGGSLEASTAFIQDARKAGILVGGAGSGSSHHVEHIAGVPREQFCVLHMDGSLYVPSHKTGWNDAPGQGSVFSDIYFEAHFRHLAQQLDLGATTLQRDEAQMALNPGYDFSPPAVQAFRRYLAEHAEAWQLAQWGIGDPETFDPVAYFTSLGLPKGSNTRWFIGWQPDDPVKQLYDRFMVDSIRDFFLRLRARLNDHVGRMVPFSCNNTSNQVWTPVHLVFDWGMSELLFRTANPEHLYGRYRDGLRHGKVQVLSTPKPIGKVEDPAAFRELNRRVIGLAYSLGGLCKVPWDLFLQTPDGGGRYFGSPAEYADLYGFVRALAPLLDGFEEAAAWGDGIPDEHGWQTLPLRLEGANDAYAFLRVRPRDENSPIVVHVLNWGDPAVPVDLLLHKPAILWDGGNAVARLLGPAAYDARLHRLAESRQATLRRPGEPRGAAQYPAYQHLVRAGLVEPLDEGEWFRLPGITASPWSVVVIDRL